MRADDADEADCAEDGGLSAGCVDPASRGRDDLLTTGDMARLSDSTLRTVRFYEGEGLIEPMVRGEGGHRYFAPSELHKLQLAVDLREAGLSIASIKELFALKRGSDCPETASRKMSEVLESQIGEMQRKIATLRRLREELVSVVSIISECQNCEDQRFPLRCGGCEVLHQPNLPRAVRVLWSQ